MNLTEHLEVLGIDPAKLATRVGVHSSVIDRALAGQPIAEPHAQNILYVLNKEHGLLHAGKKELELGDIEDLQIITPEQLRRKKGGNNATR